MVTRKPVAATADGGLTPTPASPPYPITPVGASASNGFRMQDAMGELRSADSETTDDGAWGEEGLDKQKTEHANRSLPELLRAGPKGYTPNSSQEALKPQSTGTNPFLNKQRTGSSTGGNSGNESSADAWGEYNNTPPQPTNAAPPIPQNSFPPCEQFEALSVSEQSTNPWQPALDRQATGQQPSVPSIRRQDSGNDVWSAPPAREAPKLPPVDASQPILIDVDGPESPAWDEDDAEASPVIHEMPADNVAESRQMHEDQHAWDESVGHPLQQNPVQPLNTTQNTPPEDPSQPSESWNIVDLDPIPIGAQQNGVITSEGEVVSTNDDTEQAPPLPPRAFQEHPPIQPPRPVAETNNRSVSSIVSPTTEARKQKGETYEIKRITWHDVTAAKNPRVSPILVQNANGPCPLLALVNALTLSTPADIETALVETLRSREQVSLGLLLDAVFDELMSGRRGDAAQDLPDVSDLYSFLITLHTGMNVNPRFIPSPPNKRSSYNPRSSMSHVHPSEREDLLPGTFEETREMKLYSTFSVPLIHGWLPKRESPAYTALDRSAKSYEDAQNLMFHEEELEDKLMREGLSFEEQATLEDIATIKAFFASNATQLTPYGLERITTSVAPGSVAILFRNDHFSTLYRHPDTLQLLQLVTDMGYAGHEEVVWESLIDVTGENAEFFSGDFRLVGGASSSTAPTSSSQGDAGWTTVTGRRGQNQTSHAQNLSISSFHEPIPSEPRSPNTEQEDHDLALALQLQEEEEERHRNEIARRRRETELSQQYIEQQGQAQNIPVNQRGGAASRGQPRGRGQPQPQTRGRGRGNPPPQEARPAIPPRRNNNNPSSQPVSPPPVDPEAGVDAPPPSYEQAANQAAYNPPLDHPAHPSASPNGTSSGRRMSGYTTNSQANASRTNVNRRQTGSGPTLIEQIPGRRATSGSLESQSNSRADRECAVM